MEILILFFPLIFSFICMESAVVTTMFVSRNHYSMKSSTKLTYFFCFSALYILIFGGIVINFLATNDV